MSIVPAIYYQLVYLLIITFISIGVFSKYGNYRIDRLNSSIRENFIPSFALCLFMIVYVGYRPVNAIFVDMVGYDSYWYIWNQGTYHFSLNVDNKLFDNLRIYMATSRMAARSFFVLIASIYFGVMYVACRKIFSKDTFFAYLIFLAAFSTFSYGTNGIKAGSAASIFMLALAYHDKPIVTTALALVSWGFHHSMVMVVASYLIVYCYHKPKWFFVLWGFSVLIAAAHIGVFQSLFASMADEQGQDYLTGEGSGFRIDFILYSAMPVLVGYYAIYKKKIQSKTYNIILCLYLMTNSIWMLCMYAEFTNRIAYLSWFQYPIVLIYPFLKERWSPNQYQTVMKIAFAHLAFTLFMVLIYYA